MKTLFYLLLTLFLTTRTFAQNEFITRWNLANPGSGDDQLFMMIHSTGGPVSYSWTEVSPGSASGSGTFPGNGSYIFDLPAGATIDISISPTNFSRMSMGGIGEGQRLIDVRQWGTAVWTNATSAFINCPNLQISATDVPNLSQVTDMTYMFSGCTALNGPANIGTWNTASVTNMTSLFDRASAFNQPIGTWNTANVTKMNSLFSNAVAFNQPISSWNTANVTSMNSMFSGAKAFNQPIGNWNTANVTDMRAMFLSANAFNQPIGNWNTANVTGMALMFTNALAFNQPIGSWNTANVTGMVYMFNNAVAFNQPIGNWNTTNVTNMSLMFTNALAFNQPIDSWNTINVTNMSYMFSNALAFNKPLGNWHTENVADMSFMFQNCQFNQFVANWNTAKVTTMKGMFSNDSLFNRAIDSWNTANVTDMSGMLSNARAFNRPIGNWNTPKVTDMSSMFAGASAFNQPVENWNTAKVTNMKNMFQNATVFNQPISTWNTVNVTDMDSMFFSASAFNQTIDSWTLNAAVNLDNMLDDSGLDCINYSSTLLGWSNNPLTPNNLDLGAFQRPYGINALAARANLIVTKGWSIAGDQPSGIDCSALPVRLISFTGQRQGSYVLLNWKTAGEENNAGFEIERSTDARTFEKIGFVDGGGDVSEVRKYDFTDLNPFAANYYRLKQIDFDGTFEYSSIISVKSDAAMFGIYPNPAQNQLFVKNPGADNEVSISDVEGKMLVRKKLKAATPIDIHTLPSGLFFVKIGTETQKLVIQR